jgi:SAM-dependent methyltransferase
MTEPEYVFAATHASLEAERLALLGSLYDDATHAFIQEARSLDGARVLEIGAGHGAIAMWLADQVGPSGHVLATDVDLRFLERLKHPQLEIRRHNIVTDPVEGHFDVIHARLVLNHLFGQAEAVIDKLYEALNPGGCLVFEDGDVGTAWPADRNHPRAEQWNRVRSAAGEGMRELGIIDIYFGRLLPQLFRTSRLVDVHSTATYDISAPGSDYARFDELTWISGRAGMEMVPDVTPDDVDAAIEAVRDPTFHAGEMTMVRAVGYRR